ncbi:MAG: threonine ammonia-lyase [Rhodospirillaceae bacterium]|nr:threonine ammonia-lyase [Rhodospirillaceae bacterium]
MNLVTPSDATLDAAMVRATRERTQGLVITTPTLHRPALSQLTGCEVFVKYENMQHTGAFKARGAIAKLTTLTDAQKKAGVIAVSAGNHAQGVAFHATRLGIPATIVMPKGTPFNKTRKTSDYGGKVVLEGENFTEATAACLRIAQEKDLTLIHPYDDAYVISGQGVIGFEMLEAVPDLDVIIVPVGGGGLIAGIALAAKELKPGIEIIGVEPELYPSMSNAMNRGNLPCTGATVAEGIAVRDVGAVSIPIVKKLVKEMLTVSETNMERGISIYATMVKTVAEGAGAAPLAALLQYPDKFKGRKVGLVLSGGNIDARMLSSVLMRDLVRVGQVLTLSIEMPDRPGSLHTIAGICAELGANVLEINHGRFALDLSANAARLAITIETRDEAHAQQVMDRIRAAGFTLTIRDPNET